jgi:histidine triad (HIT) family protein
MAACVFCRIVTKEIPATLVQEDERVVSFMDIGQVNPGHVLIAVKEHVEDVFALDDERAGAVFRAAARVARAVRDAFGAPGLSIYQANGAVAGQTVFHFHLHVLPRWEGDGMSLAWPVKNPPREKLEEYAAALRARID